MRYRAASVSTDGEGGEAVAGFLATVRPFRGFPPPLLQTVAERCLPLALPADEWLFRQDDEGDALYVVRSGRLELVQERPGPPTAIAVLGPGESLGELSLLLHEPRSLSARAIRDTELLRLDRAVVLDLLRDSPEFTAGLTRVVARFLQDRALRRGMADAQGTVLAVVSLHPSASIAMLRDAMAAIPARRRVTVLDGSKLAADADYSAILDAAESAHDRVFLLAGAPDSPPEWDRFCLRQADRVIALVPPGLAPPGPGEWPELDGCDVVFWCAPAVASNVGAWLDRLAPRSHHYVDPSDLTATLARALRRLAGLSVGVVLSGGGARTLAHIGAVAELTDRGVAVDRLGGSSFGALIGAMFAVGMSADEVVAACRRELVSNWPFNDYTVPLVALLRGRKLRSALHRVFGDARIEQSPLDFFAVSADLLTSELVVHRRGRYVDALAAALALPGLLPPSPVEGHLLIDGGVVSAMPIHVMAKEAEGPIVAVDVVGSRLKLRRRHALPPIVETISRSAIIGGSVDAAAARRLARLVVEPEASDTGQLDFGRLDVLVAAGRRAAASALERAGDLLAGNVTVGSGG